MMADFPFLLDGRETQALSTLDVISPVNETTCRCSSATETDVNAAV